MTTDDAIAVLDDLVTDPSEGLPDDVFWFVSRTTPMVNVDLLIQDERGRTLLAWRDDELAGTGWHLPGGIIRFKETFATRIQKVAQTEVGVDAIAFEPEPLAIHQIIHPTSDLRGHFISILYRCFLVGSFVPDNTGRRPTTPGYLRWHDGCPADLLALQDIYRPYL